MKSIHLPLFFVIFLLGGPAGNAASDVQLAAIRKLGELNGIALHCKGLAESRRMKRALVLNLPKRRQLGELFDYETNRSFMKFIDANTACPAGDTLKEQVSAAIRELESVYKPER